MNILSCLLAQQKVTACIHGHYIRPCGLDQHCMVTYCYTPTTFDQVKLPFLVVELYQASTSTNLQRYPEACEGSEPQYGTVVSRDGPGCPVMLKANTKLYILILLCMLLNIMAPFSHIE